MRRTAVSLPGILLCLLWVLPAIAEEITLRPSGSLRVADPNDGRDVRVLYQFTIPEEMLGADVVRAFLTIRTHGPLEALLSVASVDQPWSEQTPGRTWRGSCQTLLPIMDWIRGL
jgi:hypothetical protein